MSLPGRFSGIPASRFAPRLVAWATSVAIPIACCSSCAKHDNHVPVYPVRGQVFVGDKPARKAFVVFHPAGAEDPAALRPYGHAGNDGSFQLTTFAPDDGAPAGEYQVSVVWLADVGGEDPPDQLKGRYRNPQTSKLKVTIREQQNELTPFKLTR